MRCLWNASGTPLERLWNASGMPLECLWNAIGTVEIVTKNNKCTIYYLQVPFIFGDGYSICDPHKSMIDSLHPNVRSDGGGAPAARVRRLRLHCKRYRER